MTELMWVALGAALAFVIYCLVLLTKVIFNHYSNKRFDRRFRESSKYLRTQIEDLHKRYWELYHAIEKKADKT